MIEKAIYALLSADVGVQKLVGNRIYPLLTPEAEPASGGEGAYPAISYFQVSEVRFPSITGDKPQMVKARFQIDALANRYLDARGCKKAIANALDLFAGPVVTDEGTAQIRGIFGVGAHDRFDEAAKEYDTVSDFEVFYVE